MTPAPAPERVPTPGNAVLLTLVGGIVVALVLTLLAGPTPGGVLLGADLAVAAVLRLVLPVRVAGALGDPVASATVDLHVGLSEIDLEAADLDGARRHLDMAAALGERASRTESRYRWFVAMGRLAVADGDPERAVASLDQAEALYRPGFLPDVRPIAALRARVRIAQGELSEAADWARARGVSAADDVSYLSELDHLTLVRLLIAVGLSAAAAWGLREAMAELAPGEGKLHALLDLAVVGVGFLVVYLGAARVMRVTEVTDVMRVITRRLTSRS